GPNLAVWPKSATLPASFLKQVWDTQRIVFPPRCLISDAEQCDAILLDMTGDGKDEVVIVGRQPGAPSAVFEQLADGSWGVAGQLPPSLAGCAHLRQALTGGAAKAGNPRVRPLQLGSVTVPVQSKFEDVCLATVPAAASAAVPAAEK
ncbi:MAG TPA: hypothetical protein VIT92_14685, partial [Burkholderiaceae bacterium]